MLSWRSGLSPVRIILIGVAINAVFTGLISALGSITGSKQSGVMAIVNANISMKTWDDVYNLLIYVLIGLTAAVLAAGKSNLLAMEDKTVRNLGVNVIALRLAVSCIAVLLASISTAVAGTISFVGLIAPHIARIMVGSNHKVLIPFSILLGGFTVLFADTVGRAIAQPYEIPAAVVMAVIGGPFFIVLLRRSDKP
ncbi:MULTISPECIES: FecCD family ABC transporter permease [unclassified Paenibacillus]|uniref:FecCD family ABC transporter permease n=1 Tax=unclassified Paenibacillus TaxID=185978 RepID=UPI0030FA9383